MFYSRWIGLAIFIILLLIISREKSSVKQKLKYYGITFWEGMVGGIIIDSIGINAGFYHFPRQPIYSMSYFLIVLPCWGVFGMLLNFLWVYAQLLNRKVGKERLLICMAMILPPVFLLYEGLNLITNSWIYTVPKVWVVLGWFPLTLTFVACNRRRKVVFKIEYWMRKYYEKTLSHSLTRGSLGVLRIVLIVIMFPLLFSYIAEVLADARKSKNLPNILYGLYQLLLMKPKAVEKYNEVTSC